MCTEHLPNDSDHAHVHTYCTLTLYTQIFCILRVTYESRSTDLCIHSHFPCWTATVLEGLTENMYHSSSAALGRTATVLEGLTENVYHSSSAALGRTALCWKALQRICTTLHQQHWAGSDQKSPSNHLLVIGQRLPNCCCC